jgi:hypothetical protein
MKILAKERKMKENKISKIRKKLEENLRELVDRRRINEYK